jgi:8-oxo-dGTP diphosphatase
LWPRTGTPKRCQPSLGYEHYDARLPVSGVPVREETGLDIEPDALTGIYKNMPRGIIALVFRCKITGGHLVSNDEVTAFRWADQADIRQFTSEAYAIRLLDALREGTSPAIRQHDGIELLD